ncbi:CDP-alcohol phosphatidyltransferase family protein [Clostridium sp. BJN0001]|uniref:CDP-alcohol phosphatidyltransferase family protein n=1 Tax=Clostridium sp. BJN0001 TaxID=2930219 RepID=UPI001FD4208A|nr:CDP-alcohol phosphatidyltransferase family protein [Clostridium sp. BJN0001]
MSNIIYKREKKIMHLAEAFYTNVIVNPILPLVAKTPIKPNYITISNILISVFIYYLAFMNNLTIVAVLIQLYLFFDVLDGNLARYINARSKLGAKLDFWSDRFFYNLIFISIGYGRVNILLLLAVVVCVNLYAIIPTYYIVPNLRKLKNIKRFGFKKYMMSKGYIIGMDLGTVDFLLTFFLITRLISLTNLFILITAGYIIDLMYRIIELKINQKISGGRNV